MPTGKLTSFGLKAVDSDKWDGNIREAIAVAGKDGQKLVLLYNAVVAKAAVDDQVTNSATANYNGGADSEAATTVVKLGFFTMKKIDKQHNGIGGALFSVSDSGGNAVVFEKGSANGSWVRAADQSVKVDNVILHEYSDQRRRAFPLASHAADHSRRADS